MCLCVRVCACVYWVRPWQLRWNAALVSLLDGFPLKDVLNLAVKQQSINLRQNTSASIKNPIAARNAHTVALNVCVRVRVRVRVVRMKLTYIQQEIRVCRELEFFACNWECFCHLRLVDRWHLFQQLRVCLLKYERRETSTLCPKLLLTMHNNVRN